MENKAIEFLNKLPISAYFKQIKDKWIQDGSFALKSPTGSGKSLGIPLLFLRERLVNGKILIVQPRRVAARNLARVASKLYNCKLGEDIGYKVRFDSRLSQKTKIIYLTDGMIFRFLLNPEALKEINLIIFDEFHERTIFMDASLALAKFLIANGKIYSKILVTSATLDLQKVSNYLGSPNGLEVKADGYPVEIRHKILRPKENLYIQICDHLKQLLSKHEGDILIFLDGAAEIRKTVREIQNRFGGYKLDVFPLYGEMSQDSQDLALAPSKKRKIIVSTNIAETSLTIEGIKIVIDTGFSKKQRFDPFRKVNVLLSEPISKSSAEQRAGRAGRLSAGLCLRMWSENDHSGRREFDEPEIHRLDLTEIYLKLTSINVDPYDFGWYELPSNKQLEEAEKFLISIEAINKQKKVLALGNQLANLPLHPRIGFALMLAKERNCISEFSLICAALDFKNPIDFRKRSDFVMDKQISQSDLLVLLEAYNRTKETNFNSEECKILGVHAERYREIAKTARIFCEILGENFNDSLTKISNLSEIILKVYPERLAYLENKGTNCYRDFTGLSLYLSKDSIVSGAQWLLPLKVLEKKKLGKIILEMDQVTAIKQSEIRANLRDRIVISNDTYLDTTTKQVFTRTVEKVGEVVISIKESSIVSEEQRAEAYSDAIINGSLKLKNWDKEVSQFLSRINFLAAVYPEYEIQSFDERAQMQIIRNICSARKSWKEIKNADVMDFVHSFCGEEKLLLLEQAVPDKLILEGMSKPLRLRYDNQKAYLRAPIQKFFQCKCHPSIVFGRCLVVLELLAPNGMVVQCTDDILGFWERSYPTIKKELAGRYPKHEWK